MADQDILQPSQQPGTFQLLKNLLPDIMEGAAGRVGPTQAQGLGMPQAVGLTPSDVQQLLTERSQNIQEQRNQALLEKLNRAPVQMFTPDQAGYFLHPDDESAAKQTSKKLGELFPNGQIPQSALNSINVTKRTDAAKNKPKTPAGQLTPELKANLDWGLKNKLIAPAQLTYRGPKTEIIGNMLGEMRSGKIPKESLINLDAMLTGAKAGATFEASGMPQKLARSANSAANSLDILLKFSNKIPRTNVQLLNSPIISLKKQYAPEGQDWVAVIRGARLELARAYAGGNDPSEEQMKQAAIAIPDTVTANQLVSLVPTLKEQLGGVVRGAMTPVSGQPGQSESTPQSGQSINIGRFQVQVH